MKPIKKGNKATSDGVILTKKEYEEYKKIKELLEVFKTYKKDYNRTYKSYYM